MRVAVIVDTSEPYYHGGYETRAWEISRHLASRCDVTLFTTAPETAVVDHVSIVPVAPMRPYFHDSGYRDLRAAIRFAARLLALAKAGARYDIVDCNATPFVHVPAAHLLAWRWHAKFVVTAHEALGHTFRPYFAARGAPFSPLLARFAAFIYTRAQRSADLLVAASHTTASQLLTEGYRDVVPIVGAVTHVGHPHTDHKGRLVFVGRLVQNKRVPTLLRAFRIAREAKVASSLTIVGSGPLLRALQADARELELGDSVSFLGSISERAKRDLLQNHSDLYVSASVREGISIATLEALAFGVPAVIASVGDGLTLNGATEYISLENGFVAGPTPEDLAIGISYALEDRDRYRKLSRTAVQTARLYTWDAAADQLYGQYVRLLS
jgi:glycosyltransferase involved in cell wall biosynthesis